MSWVKENVHYTWPQKVVMSLLKLGPVPNHVAIIMDGNRRFAAKNSLPRADGHREGFEKLSETLQWCQDMGIQEVTVYAFSIENFKRSEDEVQCLMDIAREKFQKLLDEKEKMKDQGVRIRVIGRIDLLPLDLQCLVAKTMLFTRQNTKSTLNVCMAYTSRDEISHAMSSVARGVQDGLLQESDIDESLLERCMYLHEATPVDLLIRTSGEVRLSDFLTWQCAFSCVQFADVLWPEFSLWNMFAAIFHYQMSYAQLQKMKVDYLTRQGLESAHESQCNGTTKNKLDKHQRVDLFLERLYSEQMQNMERVAAYAM